MHSTAKNVICSLIGNQMGGVSCIGLIASTDFNLKMVIIDFRISANSQPYKYILCTHVLCFHIPAPHFLSLCAVENNYCSRYTSWECPVHTHQVQGNHVVHSACETDKNITEAVQTTKKLLNSLQGTQYITYSFLRNITSYTYNQAT